MNVFINNLVGEVSTMRRKTQGRKQALLDCAHTIERVEGVDAISIRRLADDAGVAVGTVYNYFENKQDVLFALTEDYWKNALGEMPALAVAERFPDQIALILAFLRSKMNDCAEILMQSLHENEEAGRSRMADMQRALRAMMLERLNADQAVRTGLWDDVLTKEAFTDFVLVNVLALLRQKTDDPSAFLEILNRILY